MATKFSLEAVLTATDKMTGPLIAAENKVKRTSRRMSQSFRGVNTAIMRANTSLNRGLRIAGTAAIAAAGAAIVISTKQFIEFDEAITQAGAKFKDLDVTAADYQDRLKQLGAASRDVAKITEFTATDTAGALDKMAMAGMGANQAMALLQGTTNLATAAGTDLTTAVDIATDSMGAFGLATEDVGQAEINLTRISDVMAKTTTTSNTSLLDMFESVKAGASAFTSAGQSMETFSALTGIMANAGIKGSTAGTSLRNMALRLADPTTEAAAVLKNLGVTVQDEEGNFRDFMDILADLEGGLDGMGTAQRTAALSTVFGARTVTGINTVLAAGVSNVDDYRTSLLGASGAAKEMAEAMRNSIGNRIKVLKSGLTELGLKFVEAFSEQGINVLDILIKKVQEFDIQPIINGAKRLVEFTKKLVPIVKELIPYLLGVAIAIKGWAAAMFILKIAANLSTAVIILGLLAVVAAIVFVIKHWDQLVAGAKSAVDKIKGFFKNIGTDILNDVKAAFAPVIEFFKMVYDKFIKPIVEGAKVVADLIGVGEGAGSESGAAPSEYAQQRAQQSGLIPGQLQQQRITEESRQRNDIYLNAPKGYTMTGIPGTAPSTAVQLGGQ